MQRHGRGAGRRKVALYCRVSTGDQDNDRQERDLKMYAERAELEHDLLRGRVRSGVAAAGARGQRFGRRPGYRPSDRHAPEAVRLSEIERLSQREIAKSSGSPRPPSTRSSADGINRHLVPVHQAFSVN